jgi:hypothetical protein
VKNTQYPWNVLNIHETDNKKIIKKAYAVLIKQNLPDEKPGEFKEIQAAYQQALKFCHDKYQKHGSLDQHFQLSQDKVKEQNVIDEEMNIADGIIKQIELITHDESIQLLNMRHWKFVEKFKGIYDLTLKSDTADKVFRLVAAINLESLARNKSILIPMKIVKYMEQIFCWDVEWQKYQCECSEEEISIMYAQSGLDEPSYYLTQISIKNRLKCLLIDIHLSLIIAFIILIFTKASAFLYIKYAFFTFAGLRLFTEIIMKASIGKAGYDAVIKSSKDKNSTMRQILFRHIIINLSFFPLYAWLFERYLNYKIFIFDQYVDYKIWLPIFTGIILLNILSLIFNGKLLQDVLTKTVIIHKQAEEVSGFEF